MGIGMDDLFNPMKLIEDVGEMVGGMMGGAGGLGGMGGSSSAGATSSSTDGMQSMSDPSSIFQSIEKMFGGMGGSSSSGSVERFSDSMPDSLQGEYDDIGGDGYAADSSDDEDSVDDVGGDEGFDAGSEISMGEED